MKNTKKMACAALSVLTTLSVAAGTLPLAMATETAPTAVVETAVTTYDLSENANVKIKESGVYRITGSNDEGSITVAKDIDVTLILDNASLSSTTTAPIVCKSGSNVTIEVTGTSTLTNSEDVANEASDDYEGAAIKAKSGSTLTITGTGTLNVNGASKNGIKGASDATINIESGTLNITAANDAINSSANLNVTGGTLNIDVTDDALHADGVVTIGTEGSADGPVINITGSGEGIEGAQVILNSGTGYVRATDDGVNAASDENGTVGIIVNGGNWYVNADGDGLDAGGESNLGNGSVTLNGGTVTVYGSANNGNGALDSESGIVYNGGTLIAVGMSGMAEVPSGTNVLIFGSAGGMMGGMPGSFGGQQPEMGGMPGGFQFGQMPGNQQSGLMPGMGGRGGQQGEMGGMPGQSMNQQGGAVSITEGSTITITDSDGNVIYEATGVKNANSVVFASDDLAEGETYTLSVDGKEVASTTVGANTGAPQMNGMPGQAPNGQQSQQGQPGQAPNGQQNQQGQPGQAPNGQQNQQGQPGQAPNGQQNQQTMPGNFGGQQPEMGGMPGNFGGQQPEMGGMPGNFEDQPPMMRGMMRR